MTDVDAGLGFGDGAVVGLNFGGAALDENALGGLAARGNQDAFGNGGQRIAHDDGNFGRGVAGVGQIDSNEPCVGLRARAGAG